KTRSNAGREPWVSLPVCLASTREPLAITARQAGSPEAFLGARSRRFSFLRMHSQSPPIIVQPTRHSGNAFPNRSFRRDSAPCDLRGPTTYKTATGRPGERKAPDAVHGPERPRPGIGFHERGY